MAEISFLDLMKHENTNVCCGTFQMLKAFMEWQQRHYQQQERKKNRISENKTVFTPK